MKLRPAPKMAAGWADLDGAMFELDAVLPDQYTETATDWTPEQRLMEAVLLDALRRFRKASKEATRWLFGPPTAGLYDFTNVCTTLGLDAETIRRRLLEKGNA